MKALILKFVVPTLILTAIVLLEECGKPKPGDNTDGKNHLHLFDSFHARMEKQLLPSENDWT